VVWHFQTTHHDVWDYDVAAQLTLATLRRDDREIPAVLVGTKMGFVFALERETGKPIFPIEERRVPASDVPGQAIIADPAAPPPLVPQSLKSEDAWGLVYFDRIACRDRIAAPRSEGLYTPPSLRGTLLFPFTAGGVVVGPSIQGAASISSTPIVSHMP
jgi:quinoprotein glucose dehydrogenase